MGKEKQPPGAPISEQQARHARLVAPVKGTCLQEEILALLEDPGQSKFFILPAALI